MSAGWQWAALMAVAYVLGSIPFGLLLGLMRGVDIRRHGSGNIGATNAMRVLGKRIGALCFVLDVLKGFAPTIGAGWWMGALGASALSATNAWAWLAVAAASITGHMFPVWLGFRGGKGVATGFGAMLGVWPHLAAPAALALLVWIGCALVSRYVGLSSSLAAISLPVWTWLAGAFANGATTDPAARLAFVLTATALALLVLWRHRANLARTLAGEEPKIGSKVREPDPRRAETDGAPSA